ncbi:hypothetical protein IY145_12055 [Methylosinus sp. H3A]|uniref:hypothetical protein n=1 Tax=Methylosinus sp. H3A TaxID=2785786 RepID=UPI0018C27DA4|nr:hypothetical protein [Methylosinus sp. H3A]MBG0810111.1 hypothetical protein [Methylosinus sp. H3A]
MERRIKLTDIDRPDEPLEVEVEWIAGTTLRALVPNTSIRFELRRPNEEAPFEGTLGGRYFAFEPQPATGKPTTRRK